MEPQKEVANDASNICIMESGKSVSSFDIKKLGCVVFFFFQKYKNMKVTV